MLPGPDLTAATNDHPIAPTSMTLNNAPGTEEECPPPLNSFPLVSALTSDRIDLHLPFPLSTSSQQLFFDPSSTDLRPHSSTTDSNSFTQPTSSFLSGPSIPHSPSTLSAHSISSPHLQPIPTDPNDPIDPNFNSEHFTGYDPNFNFEKNHLVTDLTGTLTQAEKSLLSKGPKFAISQAVNETTRREITISFCRLANELRWKEHWRRTDNGPCENGIPKYPLRDEIMQPPKYPDFERKLSRMNENIQKSLNSVNRGKATNLLPSERRTLEQLKNKDLMCLPSDKGGEFCIIERARYIQIGKEHLSDTNLYQEVPSMTAKTIENKINKIWKLIAQKNNLGFVLIKGHTSSNTDLARFYFLIKTHKVGHALKIRPIVSNINCPSTKMSWLLDKILKPLIQHIPSHLDNTAHLVSRLKQIPPGTVQSHNYPCSLDVVSLYTSIPHEGAVEVVEDMMLEHNYTFHNFNAHDVCNLLLAVLENNFFSFENSIYKQIHGLAMGSSVSAILAILYMGKVELRALNLLGTRVAFYARYVDDVVVLTKSRDEAEAIHETFNNIDPHIKFEIEHPTEDSTTKTLKLLDIALSIERDGTLSFDFYKKSAKKPIFVNHKSALPTRNKRNYVKNERNRIINNCSDKNNARKHMKTFNSVLKLNDYPENFIMKSSPNYNRPRNEENKTYSYFNVPYINDAINRRITKGFQREGLPVRLFHKNFSLRSALKCKYSNNTSCNKRDCILQNNMCMRKNIVYQIKCNKCLEVYIGSTIRPLHDRISEHIKNDNSSVKKHMSICGSSCSNLEIKIIDRETRKGNLRIREAFHINKCKPRLNAKEESSIDLILF